MIYWAHKFKCRKVRKMMFSYGHIFRLRLDRPLSFMLWDYLEPAPEHSSLICSSWQQTKSSSSSSAVRKSNDSKSSDDRHVSSSSTSDSSEERRFKISPAPSPIFSAPFAVSTKRRIKRYKNTLCVRFKFWPRQH